MSERVARFPGRHCRFFDKGRCLYEEHLNPGYHRRFRCTVLARFEREFDHWLARSDNFQLGPDVARSVWRDKFRAMAAGVPCSKHIPCLDSRNDESPDTLVNCALIREGVCLDELPVCEGVCTHFAFTDEKESG